MGEDLDQRVMDGANQDHIPNENGSNNNRRDSKHGTNPQLQDLKKQVTNLSRVRQLEEELAQRDQELANLKKDLDFNRRRVEELENNGKVGYPNATGDSVCTS